MPGPKPYKMIEIFSYGFMQRALLAGILVAIPTSLLGVFLVLRRKAFIGEGLAHISFAGIAIGLFFGLNPLIMALIVTLLGAFAIQTIKDRTRLYSDTVIGILSYTGFAIGIFVISLSGGFNADLFSFLFGNILTVSTFDLIFSIILSFIAIVFIIFLYPDMFHITFDEDTARTSGIKVVLLKYMIGMLTAITVVISMRIVGIILVAAFIIIPAATAIQITRTFRSTVWLSAVIGVVSVIVGLLLSALFDFAASATIILVNFVFFLFAVAFKRVI